MTSTAHKILQDALALPSEDRTALIEALSDSLDGSAVDLSTQWTAEIGNRIDDLESGAVEPVEWSAVESRIAKLINSK